MTSRLLPWLWVVAALVAGYAAWGTQGLWVAGSVIVFWLLLQWSRTMRTLRLASEAPVGWVHSAVMVHAKLHVGMTMAQILTLTRSLGQQVSDDVQREIWRWTDGSGASIQTELNDGKLTQWSLERPPNP